MLTLCKFLFQLKNVPPFRFWDSIIYFRPRYIQWRSACPVNGRFFALRKTALSMAEPTSTFNSRASDAARKVRFHTDDNDEDEEDNELSFSQEMQRCNDMILSSRVTNSNAAAAEMLPFDVSWDEFHRHFVTEYRR